jgi:hypothetical protein
MGCVHRVAEQLSGSVTGCRVVTITNSTEYKFELQIVAN